jgi:hypothetical protein
MPNYAMPDLLFNSTAGRCRPPQKLLDFRCQPVLPQRVQDADWAQLSGAEGRFSRTKTRFSAVGSGIDRA